MDWISVDDERKPKENTRDNYISEKILLYVSAFAVYQASPIAMGNYLFQSGKFRPEGSHGMEEFVTHWMPLPEPPK